MRVTIPLPKGFGLPPRVVVSVPLDPSRWDPGRLATAVLAVVLIAAGLWLLGLWPGQGQGPGPGGAGAGRPPVWRPAPPPADGRGYLACTWNVENLFDDEDDPTDHDADEDWFAANPAAVDEKVGLLADALLLQNGGRGPDVLVLVEVETLRAARLLRDELNRRLSPADRYAAVLFRENKVGRRVAPAVLSRFPARDDLTRSFPPLRILEAHLEGPGGAPLVVIACHWTSRLRDGSESRRARYAEAVYDRVCELTGADPRADVLVAGDFNDEPDDPSVAGVLHTTPDPARALDSARGGGPPLLLDMTARLDAPREGTYFYRGRWEVFDHLVASPGLLDPSGWRALPETVRVEAPPSVRVGRDGRPWRFGGPTHTGPRGPSDHFAVSVRLEVEGP